MTNDEDGKFPWTKQKYDSIDASLFPTRRSERVISTSSMRLSIFGMTLGGTILVLYGTKIVEIPVKAAYLSLSLIATSIGFIVYKYLIGGKITVSQSLTGFSEVSYSSELRRQRKDAERFSYLNAKLQNLSKELDDLKSLDKKHSYDEIVDRLKNNILSKASAEFIDSVEQRIDNFTNTEAYRSRSALISFENTRTRIGNTIISLERRGAINLVIGGIVTLMGAAMLWKFAIVDSPTNATPAQYIMHFIPRLAIVGLVQVFAFFFLKLYKIGLEEIKYFQNELTNIEQRELAISIALLADDPNLRSDILSTISKTDRNSILEKGQTTVELEKAKMAGIGGSIDLLKALAPILNKK